MALPSGEERDSLVQGNSQGRIFGIFEEMKRLSKYLFVMLLLPMSGRGQQVGIKGIYHFRFGYPKSYGIDNHSKYNRQLLYGLSEWNDSFYKSKHVRKLEVFDTLGKHHFSLWFNRQGKLIESFSTLKNQIVREYLDSTFRTLTTIRYEKENITTIDSIYTRIITYRNADTIISVDQNTLYHYKEGSSINKLNKEMNDYFMKQPPGFNLEMNGISIRRDTKIKRQFSTNFNDHELYKCREEYYLNSRLKVKGRWIDTDEAKQFIRSHPFFRKLDFEDCTLWFASGEDMIEPYKKSFENDRRYYDELSNTEKAYFSIEFFTHNIYGLNDTGFLYYYPPATEEEIKSCNYFDPRKLGKGERIKKWQNSRIKVPIGEDEYYSNNRSLIPKRIPLYTIRYEYYKD